MRVKKHRISSRTFAAKAIPMWMSVWQQLPVLRPTAKVKFSLDRKEGRLHLHMVKLILEQHLVNLTLKFHFGDGTYHLRWFSLQGNEEHGRNRTYAIGFGQGFTLIHIDLVDNNLVFIYVGQLLKYGGK